MKETMNNYHIKNYRKFFNANVRLLKLRDSRGKFSCTKH